MTVTVGDQPFAGDHIVRGELNRGPDRRSCLELAQPYRKESRRKRVGGGETKCFGGGLRGAERFLAPNSQAAQRFLGYHAKAIAGGGKAYPMGVAIEQGGTDPLFQQA